jgi:hypothetical protein
METTILKSGNHIEHLISIKILKKQNEKNEKDEIL